VERRRGSLVAIDGDAQNAGPERGRARRPGAGLSRREWGLLGLVVLAVAALAFATLRARHLESRVAALAGELARSEALVEAHREHLRAVRGGVAAVREELAGLEALAAAEPVAEPSTP
jgi:hypothetical protein